MKLLRPTPKAGLGAMAILSLTASTAAHSWIEAAYKIDVATRKFFGAPGYPRGGSFRRLSAEEGVTDNDYIHRLPVNGFYTGDENINKDPVSPNRPDETLEAAPGDYIAILHLENGHVTTKGEGRPLNSGTVYLYGTSQATNEDKLFDIHLVWNKDGTGGDGRGKLLGTRNYDDGNCYEGNPASQVAVERSARLQEAQAQDSLACQSDIQLPEDLEPGSTYTVYWYWDWPTLNTAEIDMEATKEGIFPWMGTFMRGEKDPHGFEPSVLATNESYASTIDIKIVDKSEKPNGAKLLAEDDGLAGKPDVYKEAIEKQLKDGGFAVKVGPSQGDGEGEAEQPPSKQPSSSNSTMPAPSTSSPAESRPTNVPQDGAEDGPVTVTVTKTVEKEPAPTTMPADTTPCPQGSTKTVIEVETKYTTVYPDEASSATEEAGSAVSTTSMPPAPTKSTLPDDISSAFLDLKSTPTTMATSTRKTSTLPDDISSLG
ncbi:hypothetical protein ACRE_037240 [Hapsidospora chrysogenum ATCC 11550]|uniref:DUF7492 domain-containing protein n=1 Tax=Hapsidospora chrysogenum (strain ATCC 11550 / CBS 779.69 / DSM 880 / IAM 14645 / JCM 23072 / IMI 49137) TaxID=857340 RepID=A0A086T811_HAPC1|nr:hypothetical protein ACRE_037240 [Hapsidospora chrysogenum ATCC 11550]